MGEWRDLGTRLVHNVTQMNFVFIQTLCTYVHNHSDELIFIYILCMRVHMFTDTGKCAIENLDPPYGHLCWHVISSHYLVKRLA